MRRKILAGARRVVIKIGSSLLARDPKRPAIIAAEIAALIGNNSLEAVVVSSGAIALGVDKLGLKQRPHELAKLQAVAAIGQNQLMQNWEEAFLGHGLCVGQVLLTHDDIGDRARFLSARHAIVALLKLGAVPVINENDTVAVDEIKFGDNDQLAALVCNLVAADALIMLTDVDGLHDGDPQEGGKRVPLVRDIDEEAAPLAKGATLGGPGSGGMSSKVKAAKIAGRGGVPTVVASGTTEQVLARVLSGDDIGTLFVPSEKRMRSRKHWIAYGPRPRGALVIDAGARRALVDNSRSLLASGIVAIEGTFLIGEAVSVLAEDGTELARGLVAYAAAEVQKILGRQSADIEQILGYKYIDEVIHRDDLVLVDPPRRVA